MKYLGNDKSTEALETQHARVQAEIELLPEDKKQSIRAVQKLVDHEVSEMNALFFNDGMFAADKFLIRHNIPGPLKEDLKKAIDSTRVGSTFIFDNKAFIKSYDGLVHGVQDYIRSLEMTIAEQVQYKEVKYVSYLTNFDRFLISVQLFLKRITKGRI